MTEYELLEKWHDLNDGILELIDKNIDILLKLKVSHEKEAELIARAKAEYMEKHPKVQRSERVEKFLNEVDKMFGYRKE